MLSQVFQYAFIRPYNTLVKKQLLQDRDWILGLGDLTQVIFLETIGERRSAFAGGHITAFKVRASDVIFLWFPGNKRCRSSIGESRHFSKPGGFREYPRVQDSGLSTQMCPSESQGPILLLPRPKSSKQDLSSFHSQCPFYLCQLYSQILSANFQYGLL